MKFNKKIKYTLTAKLFKKIIIITNLKIYITLYHSMVIALTKMEYK